MKYTKSSVLAALFASSATAIKQTTSAGPDIFGPNGENYENNDPNYDLSRIGISITEKGKGAGCTAPNWATFHWKSILGDGREIENTKERFGEGQITRPDTITVGSRQSFHCFDLAFPSLKAGDKATLKCPAYYAYGGAHTISPLSDFTIPLNSDVTFEVEMLECGEAPHAQPLSDFDQPHTTTMQPDKCIVFRSYEEQGSGNTDFVLSTVGDTDGTRILAIEHYQQDDKDQEWYYREKHGQIYNAAYPDQVIDAHAGAGRRLQLAKRDEKDANAFQNNIDYTRYDQLLTSEGFPFTVDHDTNYVHYAGAFGGPGGEYGGIPQHWHIMYCKGEPQNKLPKDLGYVEGWAGKYYFFTAKDSWSDGYDALIAAAKPAQERVDKQLNWNSKRFFDLKQLDRVRGEWAAKIEIDREGDYSWKTCSDDGSRLSINDKQVIDNWGLHGRRCRDFTGHLSIGWHDLSVSFFNGGGGANLVVLYKGPDSDD